jgi:hypothetical protein
MATTNRSAIMATEKIFIQIDNERIELTGEDKKKFIADQESREQERLLLEAEYQAKQDARDSAIKKLGEIAGLTKEELDAIL